MSKTVIVDLDVGTDDAFALFLLLSAEKEQKIKIAAITCVNGNTSAFHVYNNVRRLLKICNREDIPVYVGACNALISHENFYNNYFHGNDGFGDLEYEDDNVTVKDNSYNKSKIESSNKNIKCEKIPIANAENLNAVNAINKIVMENPKQITLICLGPLTNAALALKVYSQFAENVKEIFVMGGNYQGVGNITCTAEFNFHVDPEAAFILLHDSKCPITLLPWEPCVNSTIPMDWRFDVLGALPHPAIKLLNAVEKRIYDKNALNWRSCDAFLVAAFLYPELIKNTLVCNITVELQGLRTRGQMVINRKRILPPNATVITDLHFDLFKSIMLKALANM